MKAPSRERIELQGGGMGGGGQGKLIRFETLSESELDRDPVLGRFAERVRGHGGAGAGSCNASAPSDDCAAAAASAAGV